MADYAHPEVLVSTDWVAQNLDNDGVRLVEVDVDTASWESGHIPGSIGWNWQSQLCDTVRRDIVPRDQFQDLMRSSGIDTDTTVVLYGDNKNWFAAWAFWQLKLYGFDNVKLMDGGRAKWLAEERALTTDPTEVAASQYDAPAPDFGYRAFLSDVQDAVKQGGFGLVDVRSPAEFSGEILAPPGLPETCQRGGHIPGAANISWGKACNDDGTFKSHDELAKLYGSYGITPEKPTIAYCRIGERSSHSWFVLKYLLGFENVTNYDGSWTEWGNLVGAPVETGA